MVSLVYVGTRAELFSVRGPATGMRYYMSAAEHERLVPVYVEDAPGLVAMRDWARAGGKEG